MWNNFKIYLNKSKN